MARIYKNLIPSWSYFPSVWTSRTTAFQELNTHDSDDFVEPAAPKASSSHLLKSNVRFVATISSLTIAIIIIEILAQSAFLPDREDPPIAIMQQNPPAIALGNLRQCGSSPAEAEQLGCIFDSLSFSWQVPACYQNRTIRDFEAVQAWSYYTDESGATPVSVSDLPLSRQLVHVEWEFHLVHCMFTRRQFLRALIDRLPMDVHVTETEHTAHCARVMLNTERQLHDLHTAAPVIFPFCESFEEWTTPS